MEEFSLDALRSSCVCQLLQKRIYCAPLVRIILCYCEQRVEFRVTGGFNFQTRADGTLHVTLDPGTIVAPEESRRFAPSARGPLA